MTAKHSLTLRVDPELRDRLEAFAAADLRSMNDLIIAVMTCWMDGRRYEPVARVAAPKPPAPATASEAESAPYRRPRGRPAKLAPGARDPYIIGALKSKFSADYEGTLAEILAVIAPNGHGANFDVALAKNLALAGWQNLIRSSDGASVWLAPEHPHAVTE